MRIRWILIVSLGCWLVLSSTHAAPGVVREHAAGYFDPKALRGPAAPTVEAYLDETYVKCTDIKRGAGLCNLRASTESLTMFYGNRNVVAFINYDDDTGNIPSTIAVMWRSEPDGYRLLAKTADVGLLTDAHVTSARDNSMTLKGLVQGPDDSFCCPSTKVAYTIAYVDDRLFVERDILPRRAHH